MLTHEFALVQQALEQAVANSQGLLLTPHWSTRGSLIEVIKNGDDLERCEVWFLMSAERIATEAGLAQNDQENDNNCWAKMSTWLQQGRDALQAIRSVISKYNDEIKRSLNEAQTALNASESLAGRNVSRLETVRSVWTNMLSNRRTSKKVASLMEEMQWKHCDISNATRGLVGTRELNRAVRLELDKYESVGVIQRRSRQALSTLYREAASMREELHRGKKVSMTARVDLIARMRNSIRFVDPVIEGLSQARDAASCLTGLSEDQPSYQSTRPSGTGSRRSLHRENHSQRQTLASIREGDNEGAVALAYLASLEERESRETHTISNDI